MAHERKHPLLMFRESHDPMLSQVEAAKLVGIDQSMWSLLERGLAHCRPRVARRISRVTGCALELLLDFGDNDHEMAELGASRKMR